MHTKSLVREGSLPTTRGSSRTSHSATPRPLPTTYRSTWSAAPSSNATSVLMQVLTWDVADAPTIQKNTGKMTYEEKQTYLARNTQPSAEFRMTAIGIGPHGESCALHVVGFQPYFYIKLPPVATDERDIHALLGYFQDLLPVRERNELAVAKCHIEHYYTYYGYQWDTKQAFLKLVFHSDRCRKRLARLLERGCKLPSPLFGHYNAHNHNGSPYHYFQLFESNCEALVRFFHEREINPSGWVALRPGEYTLPAPSLRETRAHMEFECTYKQVHASNDTSIGKIMMASFDIEADSSHGDFPVAIKDHAKPANELIALLLSHTLATPPKKVSTHKLEQWLRHMYGVKTVLRVSNDVKSRLSRVYPSEAATQKGTVNTTKWGEAARRIHTLYVTAITSDLHEGDVVNVHTPGKSSSEKDRVVEIRVQPAATVQGTKPTQYQKEYRLKKMKSAAPLVSHRAAGVSDTDSDKWFRLVDADGTTERNRKSISRENGFRPMHLMSTLEWGRRKKQLLQKLIDYMSVALPELAGDRVIQIGTVFWRYGDDLPCLKHVITLDTCEPIEGVVVESYATEAEVLARWSEVMCEMAPNIVTGYNIFGFDYKFMWERADVLGVENAFGDLSPLKHYVTTKPHRVHNETFRLLNQGSNVFLPGRKPGEPRQCRCNHSRHHCKLIEKELTSAGLGENRMYFMDVPGVAQIDMMKDIMKDHSLNSYKLDDVASHFIHGQVQSFQHVVVEEADGEDVQEADVAKSPCAPAQDSPPPPSDSTPDVSLPKSCASRLRTRFQTDNATGISPNDYLHLYRMSVVGREPVENDRKFKVVSIDPVDGTGEGFVFTLDAHAPSLDATANYQWGIGKDDVSPQDIFRMQKQGARERAVIAKYCVQDCHLVLTLMNKLQTVSNNLGMCKVCSVPFQYIFTRGQGIKTFSLLSRECRARNYRIPYRRSDGLVPITMGRAEQDCIFKKGFPPQSEEPADEKETYQGAFVLDPKPGIYLRDAIAVLDYSSLYPSSIISHNLCASTIVLDPKFQGKEGADRLRAKGLHFKDVTYDNYISVRKGVTYEKTRNAAQPTTTCRFIQPPFDPHDHSIVDADRGILPQTLRILLSQRKATRKRIKTEKDPFVCAVLDGLQLAYKVTANSVYGSLGATTNPIFFKDIAAATTATGREMLLFAKTFVTTHFPGSEIVYGDTDSIFINFHPKDADGQALTGEAGLTRTIELGVEAGKRATAELQEVQHLAPQDLEYEKTFYPFILLSKKRYAAMKYEFDPKKGKLNYMGIVLKRRDNAPIVKVLYADVLDAIMNARSIPQSIERLRANLQKLIAGEFPLDYLVISKSLRSHYDNPDQIVHKVLADRMAERDPGNKPQANDRIPYAYIDVGDRKVELQGERVEHPDYILAHNLRTDATFYITNQISKPIAQIYALVIEQMPGYKHRNDPHHFENVARKYRDQGRSEDKIRKKIEDLRIEMATAMLFGRYLRIEKNRREGSRSITDFFKVKR